MARRLRDDLLRRLLPPMAIILLVSGMFSYQLAVRFANRSYDRSLLEDARSLSRLVKLAPTTNPLILPSAALEMLEPGDGDKAFIQIRSRTRGVIAGDPDLPLPEAHADSDPHLFDGTVRGKEVRLVAMPMRRDDEALVILVGETRGRRKSLASDIVVAVVVPQLILIVFAIVIIVSGVASGLKPLEILARSLKDRRSDELAPMPDSAVPGEAVPLINAFNGLLTRMAEVLTAQQRFVADAAHQLRTPLAALKIQLEQALREADFSRRQELLAQLKGSVDRTARLSSQLLLLARAEPGGEMPSKQRIDLRALALDAGGLWVPRALQVGRDLGFTSADEPVWVVGDGTLLGEMMANLLDNALRYGGANVTLSVVAESPDTGPQLIVEDDGPGIPEVERERVFERFHRVPGTNGDGSGLGLAIVREIAHSHGAEVALKSPATGGLQVCVTFPSLRLG